MNDNIKKIIGDIFKQLRDHTPVGSKDVVKLNRIYNRHENKNISEKLYREITDYLNTRYVVIPTENLEWDLDSTMAILDEIIKTGKSPIHLNISLNEFRELRNFLNEDIRSSEEVIEEMIKYLELIKTDLIDLDKDYKTNRESIQIRFNSFKKLEALFKNYLNKIEVY